VGGVINIITKIPGGKPQATLKLEKGSYDTNNVALALRGETGNLRMLAIGNYKDTGGYRERGYLRNKNMTLKAEYDIGDIATLSAKVERHRDRYGFPGPLTKKQWKKDPRQSLDPTDSYGNTLANTYMSSIYFDLEDWGEIDLKVAYKQKAVL